MYQALLTRRYLTRKVMPLLAVAAVTLCTAMVLIVWSVMAGFLATLLDSGRKLVGDVAIQWPVTGIPYYEDLIERLEADPLIEAAAPTLETHGLLGLPDGSTRTIKVVGVEGDSYDAVTGYASTIWWKPIEKPLEKDPKEQDPRLAIDPEIVEHALTLTEPDPQTGEARPAVALGLEATGYNEFRPGGWYLPRFGYRAWEDSVTLSVLPLSQKGVAIDVQARRFPVANEFSTGLYDVDARTALVRLDALQEMLDMDEAARIESSADELLTLGADGDFADPRIEGVAPARVTDILLAGAGGADPRDVQQRAQEIYAAFSEAHERSDPRAPPPGLVRILRWEELPGLRTFVAAVKKETALVLTLFSFISVTAAFLVFAIFWAMVSEKTRDIGVLRALGASRAGVAWIYVRYGLGIGVVGSVVGLSLAYLIVLNINPIHEWLGEALGLVVWDPTIYHFARIPSEVDGLKALIVFAGGLGFSVIGALAPALRAARLDPVKALRFE